MRKREKLKFIASVKRKFVSLRMRANFLEIEKPFLDLKCENISLRNGCKR